MLKTRGFKLSLAGAIVFLVGLLSLIVLPLGLSMLPIIAGGMAVWIGFLMTLFGYYRAPPAPPDQR